MVWPVRQPAVSGVPWHCWRAIARAATSIAGLCRKTPAFCSEATSDHTSRSSALSPAHACRKNSLRSAGGRSSTACSRSSTRCQRSDSIACLAGQLAIEPGPGGAPIAHHGDGRYFKHLGRLFHTESAKESHLDDLHFAWIEPRQGVQSVVQRHQVAAALVAAHHGRLFRSEEHTSELQ